MRVFFTIAINVSFLILTTDVGAVTWQQCNAMASQINKSLPMDVDAVTKMKSVICLPGKVKPTLMYLYEIDASSMPSISANDLLTLKPTMVE